MGRLFSLWHAICRHKYAVTFVLFLLMLTFADEDSFLVRYQRNVEIGRLQKEIDRYAAMYEDETRQLESLEHDPAAVERLARERYYMKRPNEDLYIVAEKEVAP